MDELSSDIPGTHFEWATTYIRGRKGIGHHHTLGSPYLYEWFSIPGKAGGA